MGKDYNINKGLEVITLHLAHLSNFAHKQISELTNLSLAFFYFLFNKDLIVIKVTLITFYTHNYTIHMSFKKSIFYKHTHNYVI